MNIEKPFYEAEHNGVRYAYYTSEAAARLHAETIGAYICQTSPGYCTHTKEGIWRVTTREAAP